MKKGHEDLCEVEIQGKWTLIDIDDALKSYLGEVMRCPKCHGRVCAHKAYSDGARAHFEHYRAHSGCPLKPGYSGAFSMHPNAVS
jgi:hypothetical protein